MSLICLLLFRFKTVTDKRILFISYTLETQWETVFCSPRIDILGQVQPHGIKDDILDSKEECQMVY